MLLKEYQQKTGLSYRKISAITGVPKSIVWKACNEESYCPPARYCHALIKWTEGRVSLESLLGDC